MDYNYDDIKDLNYLTQTKDLNNLISFLNKRDDNELYLAALELAIANDFNKAFDYILAKDLDFSSSNVVSVCAISQKNELLEKLLDDGRFDPNGNNGEPFYHATLYDSELTILLFLRDDRTDPTLRWNGAIINLIDQGRTDIAKNIIRNYDVDLSIPNQEIIASAARTNDLELVELLLSDDNVDPSYRENTAAIISTHGESVDIVSAFMRHPKVNINEVRDMLCEEYDEDRIKFIDKVRVLLRDEKIDEILS